MARVAQSAMTRDWFAYGATPNEALEWLHRAEQAREVAGQLTDADARKAVLQLADSFDRLARAATPAVLRRRELAKKE
jgi:hypothetical protein